MTDFFRVLPLQLGSLGRDLAIARRRHRGRARRPRLVGLGPELPDPASATGRLRRARPYAEQPPMHRTSQPTRTDRLDRTRRRPRSPAATAASTRPPRLPPADRRPRRPSAPEREPRRRRVAPRRRRGSDRRRDRLVAVLGRARPVPVRLRARPPGRPRRARRPTSRRRSSRSGTPIDAITERLRRRAGRPQDARRGRHPGHDRRPRRPVQRLPQPRRVPPVAAGISGQFEGIGAEIGRVGSAADGDCPTLGAGLRHGRHRAARRRSPAEKAGLLAGDRITGDRRHARRRADRRRTRWRRSAGPKGTTVTLTVVRGRRAPFELPIVRD